MRIETFMEEQPKYRYMKLPDGTVDVFIYKLVEVKENEEGKEYLYQFNQFNVKEDDLPEKTLKKSPYNYLDYEPKEFTETERIDDLEKRLKAIEDDVTILKEQ